MNKPTVDTGRRRLLLGAATALASLPLLRLVPDAHAAGEALPHLAEVSIGHALIADARHIGLAEAVRRYLAVCRGEEVEVPVTR